MKSESEQLKVKVFFGALACIAIVINVAVLKVKHPFHSAAAPASFLPVQPAPILTAASPVPVASSPVVPPPPTPEQIAATERANFLSRYVNPGGERTSTSKAIAVVAASPSGQSRTIADSLVQKLRVAGVEFKPSFFKQAFTSDGVFEKAFNGASLPLGDALDGLLLAKEDVQYEKHNSSLANTITAHIRLDIAVIPLSASVQSQSWSLTANGVGFTQTEAQSNAEERLQKQIAENTRMTLN